MTSPFAAVLIGIALTTSASAEEIGNASQGETLAKTVCAECHRVEKGDPRAGRSGAPSFTRLAATPGMTPTAIGVALRTSHQKMPNLVLSNSEIDNIVAYLAALR